MFCLIYQAVFALVYRTKDVFRGDGGNRPSGHCTCDDVMQVACDALGTEQHPEVRQASPIVCRRFPTDRQTPSDRLETRRCGTRLLCRPGARPVRGFLSTRPSSSLSFFLDLNIGPLVGA